VPLALALEARERRLGLDTLSQLVATWREERVELPPSHLHELEEVLLA
jgi:hypothetical protein